MGIEAVQPRGEMCSLLSRAAQEKIVQGKERSGIFVQNAAVCLQTCGSWRYTGRRETGRLLALSGAQGGRTHATEAWRRSPVPAACPPLPRRPFLQGKLRITHGAHSCKRGPALTPPALPAQPGRDVDFPCPTWSKGCSGSPCLAAASQRAALDASLVPVPQGQGEPGRSSTIWSIPDLLGNI